MADEIETRLRECERGLDRMDGRLGRVEEDMKVFRPIPIENADYRATTNAAIKELVDDVHEAFEGIRGLRTDIANYIAEQVKIREAREERERLREQADRAEKTTRLQIERRDRWQRWATVLTLSLAFVSMTVGWVVLAF